MIKHIVMWKLKEENKLENAKHIKEKLEALKDQINEISEIEVGININDTSSAFDVVLYSTFNTLDDLNSYSIHPKHKEVGEFIGGVRTERIVVDYEV